MIMTMKQIKKNHQQQLIPNGDGDVDTNQENDVNEDDDDQIIIDMDVYKDKDLTNVGCSNCWCNVHHFILLASYFFTSQFLHCIMDFPLHGDEYAHSHFVPFTNWKYDSPVSQYDVDRYAYVWISIELITGILFPRWILKINKDQWKDSKCQWLYIWWMIVMIGALVFFIIQFILAIVQIVS